MKKVLALYMRDSISRNAFCPLSLQFSTWKNSRIAILDLEKFTDSLCCNRIFG